MEEQYRRAVARLSAAQQEKMEAALDLLMARAALSHWMEEVWPEPEGASDNGSSNGISSQNGSSANGSTTGSSKSLTGDDDKKYARSTDIANLRQGLSVTATIDTGSDGQ